MDVEVVHLVSEGHRPRVGCLHKTSYVIEIEESDTSFYCDVERVLSRSCKRSEVEPFQLNRTLYAPSARAPTLRPSVRAPSEWRPLKGALEHHVRRMI